MFDSFWLHIKVFSITTREGSIKKTIPIRNHSTLGMSSILVGFVFLLVLCFFLNVFHIFFLTSSLWVFETQKVKISKSVKDIKHAEFTSL